MTRRPDREDAGPLVSVIVACGDRPYLLRTRTIPSVLAQTHTHWELILVGGAGTAAAVASASDERVRHVHADPGSTDAPDSAFDLGVAAAAGAMIAPLVEGDAFTPEHLAHVVAALSNGDADLVYGTVMVRDPNTGAERPELRPWSDPASRTLLAQGRLIEPSSAGYLAAMHVDARGADPAERWRTIERGGARIASLEAPQARRWGEPGAVINISLPSLPPVDAFVADVADILDSRWTSNSGPFCERLERALADVLDVPHVVSAPSGDVALGMAFQAVRSLRPDRDEVVVPSYTFPSTANAVIRAGLRPRFCDVGPSLCATVADVTPHVTGRTAAIAPVHAHGIPCDMPGMEALASANGAMLVADAAAAFGASLGQRRVGGFGDAEVFSFSSTKVVTAGEGGAIACSDGELASLLRRIGRYGLRSDYGADVVGINGRLAELPAALLLRSLPFMDEWSHRRRTSAERYVRLLEGCPDVRMPEVPAGAVGTWKDVPLIVATPDAAHLVVDRLAAYGVQSRPYYRPLHRMEAFRALAADPLPVADGLDGRVVCVPIFNDIADDTVDLVAGVVRETLEGAG